MALRAAWLTVAIGRAGVASLLSALLRVLSGLTTAVLGGLIVAVLSAAERFDLSTQAIELIESVRLIALPCAA